MTFGSRAVLARDERERMAARPAPAAMKNLQRGAGHHIRGTEAPSRSLPPDLTCTHTLVSP